MVDPLAEKYQPFSGYNYVLNNPISNIDPDVREVKHDYQLLKNGEVKLIKETQDKSDTFMPVMIKEMWTKVKEV